MKRIIFLVLALLCYSANAQIREANMSSSVSVENDNHLDKHLVSTRDPGLFMWGYGITPCIREGLGLSGSVKGSIGSFYDTINLEAAVHAFLYLGFEDDNTAAKLISFPMVISPRVNMIPQTRYQPMALSFSPDFIFVPGKEGIHFGGTLMYTSHRMSFGLVAWPEIFYGISVSIYHF